MTNFGLDISVVQKALYNNPNKIPVKGNRHKMVRVAFDLFRLKDDSDEDLWRIQADDDGEFLVRTYSLPEDEEITTSSSEWTVNQDEKHANLTISYKGIPIQRLAVKDCGVTTTKDTLILRNIVLKKLSNKNFIYKFFNNLPEVKKNILKAAGFIENEYNETENEEEQEAADYRKYFLEKAKEFGLPDDDVSELSDEERKSFFEELDRGWEAKNECVDTVPQEEVQNLFATRLSALELKLQKEAARDLSLNTLEIKLQKNATDENETISDEKFQKMWWDSGMETYGPGAAAGEGLAADVAYLLDKTQYILSTYDLDEDEKKKLEDLAAKLNAEEYSDAHSGDELETFIFKLEDKYEGREQEIEELNPEDLEEILGGRLKDLEETE